MKWQISLIFISLIFGGCTAKEPLIKTEFKEIYKPIKCLDKMPLKPKFDENNATSAIDLMRYYKECEALLMECVKDE